MAPTRSSPGKGAGAAAGAAGLAGCEGERTGRALRARVGRGAGFFFATLFFTGGVFLRVIGRLAGVSCRLGLAFFLVAICVAYSCLSSYQPSRCEGDGASSPRSTRVTISASLAWLGAGTPTAPPW